jgi:serine/threonine protein kinase
MGPDGGALDADAQQEIEASAGHGQRLDGDLNAELGHAFGRADFSRVTLHTDSQADSLNRSLNAKAFTLGRDIFFRQGAYQPHTSEGKSLLAHELTHTIQQGAVAPQATPDLVQRQSEPMIQRLITKNDLIKRAGDPELNKVVFGFTYEMSSRYRRILAALDAYHTAVASASMKDPPSLQKVKESLGEVGGACSAYIKAHRKDKERTPDIRTLLNEVRIEDEALDVIIAAPDQYQNMDVRSAILTEAAKISDARQREEYEKEKARKGGGPKIEGNLGGLFGGAKGVEGPVGFTEEVGDDAPSLEGMKSDYTDKYAEGESHISTFKTKDKRQLVAKIERSVAAGNLKKELEAYRHIYKTAGKHPNLGRVYGMAIVPYGMIKVEAMIMDEIPGMRGSEAMAALREAWQAGQISSAEYWGAIQYIGRKMLEVVAHLKQAGIAHNDIKPDNFVVDQRSGEPIVIDLGLHSKQGDRVGGATKEYAAPEMMVDDETPGVGSEKGDVFTVGSTLLGGVEGMLGGSRGKLPKHGLTVKGGGESFTRDKEGNAQRVMAVAGVKTSYTDFMGSVMEHNPESRPDAPGAQKSGFLSDSLIDDESARNVLKRVVGRKLPDIKPTDKPTDKPRVTKKQIDEAMNGVSRSGGVGRNGGLRELTTGAQARNLADSTTRLLKALAAASALADQAEEEGMVEEVKSLREQIARSYASLSRTGLAKPPTKKELKKGAKYRPEMDEVELGRVVAEANATGDGVDALLKTPHISDLRQLATLKLRVQALHDVLPQATRRPRFFGVEPKPLPTGVSEARARMDGLLPLIDNQVVTLEKEQANALKTAQKLLGGGWYEPARAALEKFDAVKPVVRSGLTKPSKEGAERDKAIQEAAAKAIARTKKYQVAMQKFSNQALSFLGALGKRPLTDDQLDAARTQLGEYLTVAGRVLRLEQEWLPQTPAKTQSVKARAKSFGELWAPPKKLPDVKPSDRWKKLGKGKWQDLEGDKTPPKVEKEVEEEQEKPSVKPSSTKQKAPHPPTKMFSFSESELESSLEGDKPKGPTPLEARLQQDGLIEHPIDGDGNCFYASVIHQLEASRDRTYRTPQALRNALADQLARSGGDDTLQSIVRAHSTTIGKVAANIRTNRSWNGLAGDIAPELTANMLRRQILIYHAGGVLTLDPRQGALGGPLRIVYNGSDHYNSTSVAK